MQTMETNVNEVKTSPSRRKEQKILQKQEKRMQRIHQRRANDEEKSQRRSRRAENRASKEPVRRLFPIWLRIIVVLVLAYGAMVAGMMIGYSILGDGSPAEAIQMDTWRHIIQIVTGDVEQ